MNDIITIELTKSQFNNFKTILGKVPANDGYFALRQFKNTPTTPNAKTIVMEFTSEQFAGLRNALARATTNEASAALDIMFDVGEPQFTAIYEAKQKAAIEQQAALGELKEVTVADIKKAKAKATKAAAKPRVKVKAGSRKAG